MLPESVSDQNMCRVDSVSAAEFATDVQARQTFILLNTDKLLRWGNCFFVFLGNFAMLPEAASASVSIFLCTFSGGWIVYMTKIWNKKHC